MEFFSPFEGKNGSLFTFEGQYLPVKFIETTQIDGYPDVICDVYNFEGDESKDLGVIYIKNGAHTPPQRVDRGERTIEGFLAGKGKLTILRKNGQLEHYDLDECSTRPYFTVDVQIGDVMQWQADSQIGLIAYEVCIPSYIDGRYTNLPHFPKV